MPVKNEALYIEAALRSISGIDALEFEVIIIDDGSSDNTCQTIESLSLGFVRLIKTAGIGKAAAFNLAYTHAKGDVFILFAGDDLFVPEIIESRILPIKNDTEPHISFCKLKSFSNNKKYDSMVLPKAPALGLESGGCMAFNQYFGDLAFPIPVSLPNEDVWLMLHARYLSVKVSHVPQVGIFYRIHENNSYKRGIAYSQINEQVWLRQRAIFYFYEHYRASLGWDTQRKLLSSFTVQLLRYLGCSAILLLVPGTSLKEKIKTFFNSSPLLYAIRERFYKFFSGR